MKTHSFRMTAGLLTGVGFALGAMALGCDGPMDMDTTEPLAEHSSESTAQVVELGSAIADHPLYAALSQRATERFASVVGSVSEMDASQVSDTLSKLTQCQTTPGDPACAELLSSLGISGGSVQQDVADAQQIAADLDLDAVSPAMRAAAFRRAQIEADGAGSSSAMLPPILDDAGFSCDAGCTETLGNALGGLKGDYTNDVSYAAQGGSGGGAGGGDGAGWVAIITGVVSVVLKLEDLIWNSNEEDKECIGDDDCGSNEFCHKIGDNDCRPALSEGALCSRGAQCLSNCCKPHISAAFLPICRPADRCN
jgi:hypothetical protein